MNTRNYFATLLCIALLVSCSDVGDNEAAAGAAITPEAVLNEVSESLGMQGVEAVTWSGSAWTILNRFRQTPNASPPWNTRADITGYTRTLDLGAIASSASGEIPSQENTYTRNIGADSAWAEQLEIWLTPWGFVQGAQNNGVELSAAMVDGISYRVLTWRSPANQTAPSGLPYTVSAYINSQGLINRTETWVEDAFMGDLHVEMLYSDYTDMNGLMVPAIMEQRLAGGGVFGVNVASAQANPDDLAGRMEMPVVTGSPNGGAGADSDAVPTDFVEQVAEGVYLVNEGYVAMVVEFSDHVVVFEAGQSEAHGQLILDAVTGTFPEKPIRYIVNSHPHSDHTAGLVPFVREGITIITHVNNVEFLEMGLSTPRTLPGEETLEPRIMAAYDGVTILNDASMRLELHHVPNLHTDSSLVAFVPSQRILFQADFTLPQPGATATPWAISLAQYIDETGLDFGPYLAVHAASEPQTREDVLAILPD